MRIPLDWLKDYVDIDLSPQELAHRLTMAGLETEVVPGHDWSGVSVGLVTRVEAHPNADRLSLVTVDTGSGESKVVCGAPNVAEGQKIAYAAVGAHLIDGHSGEPMVLKPAKIRGVESAGMVCSERELGLSDEHEGILVLGDDAPVGAPLADYMGSTILETSPTPNRPDHFSVVGVAHEVAALTGSSVRPPVDSYSTSGKKAAELATVSIEDPDLCTRYVATVVTGVKVAESPPWLQKRLLNAGMRPINNVVDVTNYVMLELGQPLHAFDYDRLRGHAVVARRARPGESMITLDGVRRELDRDTLVIADAERPLVIAGIFGGEDAEVGDSTTNVLLEAANFDAVCTRKSSVKYDLRTEAARRFERGTSSRLPPVAARRATKLFVELCGGTAASGLIDVHPGEKPVEAVNVTQGRLDDVLGTTLPPAQITSVLQSLGFAVKHGGGNYVVAPPDWRVDVRIDDDVAEEVARIIGYDSLPTRTLSGAIPAYQPNESREFREEVRNALSGAGLQEVITYSMTNLAELQRALPAGELEVRPPLRIVNPLSSEWELARTTLRASILRTMSQGLRQVDGPVAIFEIAAVYWPREDDLPEEKEMAVGALGGRALDRWGHEAEPVDFFLTKGILDAALARLHIGASWNRAEDYALIPGRSALLGPSTRAGGGWSPVLGVAGQVDPKIATAFDIDGDVYLFELDVDALRAVAPVRVEARPVVRYPAVTRDLAFIVDASVPSDAIRVLIEEHKLVAGAGPFDVYQGSGVPQGKKSIAFAVSYQAPDRTLTDQEVNRAEDGIVTRLKRELGAERRG
jgi:phenylalanyl-tRNA synthetase beta chain